MTAAAKGVEQANFRVKTKEVIISSLWSDMEITYNSPHTKYSMILIYSRVRTRRTK